MDILNDDVWTNHMMDLEEIVSMLEEAPTSTPSNEANESPAVTIDIDQNEKFDEDETDDEENDPNEEIVEAIANDNIVDDDDGPYFYELESRINNGHTVLRLKSSTKWHIQVDEGENFKWGPRIYKGRNPSFKCTVCGNDVSQHIIVIHEKSHTGGI